VSKAHVNFDDMQPSEMLGEYLQPIQALIDDNTLTEICINRTREVWTEGNAGWQRHDVPELSFTHCRQLATLIASYNGKSISADKPVLSSALPNGERVQVIIPPACEANTVSITIRKPSVIDLTLDELDAQGAFQEIAQIQDGLKPFEQKLLQLRAEGKIKDFLDLGVRSQRNILIAGKTGSGKTTVTKSLIRSIPLEERLITIEDVHELFLNQHPNKVHLFYSREDEGGSKVSPKQALASCLRMKPDRILLAELRGDEAWEFIKSVNTGHPGSISTMHANGAFEAFEQLTALIKDSRTGAHLDTDYIQQRLFTTIDIVLFYHQRRLREIYYDPLTKLKYLTNAQPMMGLGSAQAAVESTVAAEEIADKKELEERYQMAAAYMRVLQSSNRLLEQHAAIAKYAALKTAFSKRDAIMARADGVSQPQVVADSADKHIVASILSGHISTLNIAEYQASEHQPVEKHHELQG
jgi:type IV secretion system protein VirB11